MTEMTIMDAKRMIPALTDNELTEIRIALRMRVAHLEESIRYIEVEGNEGVVGYLADAKTALAKVRDAY
jgi:hypothetical protein